MNPQHTYLWIDASARTLRAGVLCGGRWLAYRAAHKDAPALENFPSTIRETLADAALDLNRIQGFIHCEGPGSVLGIRVAAAAIEAWRSLPAHRDKPVCGYRGLELAGWILKNTPHAPENFCLLTESRLKRVNVYYPDTGVLREIPESSISSLTAVLYHLPQRMQPPAALAPLEKFQPDRMALAAAFFSSGLVRATARATVYNPSAPDYKKWPGLRHSK